MSSIWTASQLRHRARWAAQFVLRPKVSIIGGYHGGNLGDIALGRTLASLLPKRRAGLQTIYTIRRWPKGDYFIVGGGAVIYEHTVRELARFVGAASHRLALVGVDFETQSFGRSEITFLRRLPYISVRSSSQKEALSVNLGLPQMESHPDLVFASMPQSHTNEHGDSTPRRSAGINVSPKFWRDLCRDGGLRALKSWDNYSRIVRRVAMRFLDERIALEHFPFTPQDDIVAELIFRGLPVKRWRYSDNLSTVRRRMAACSHFFASRYHSVIICLVARIPVVPFLYADKSYRLFSDYFPTATPLGARDLSSESSDLDKVVDTACQPMIVDRGTLDQLATKVQQAVSKATTLIGLHHEPNSE